MPMGWDKYKQGHIRTEASAWILLSRIRQIWNRAYKSKGKDAHADGVGFYSLMYAMVFGDTRENVSEVIAHVFFLYLIKQLSITY